MYIQQTNTQARINLWGIMEGLFLLIMFANTNFSRVVNASHTTPTIHVNWGPMLLKLIGGDIVCVLCGSYTYPKSRSRPLTLNHALPLGSHVICIT